LPGQGRNTRPTYWTSLPLKAIGEAMNRPGDSGDSAC
jgi:hypothetical protein